MLFARHIRLALVGAVLLLSQAQATFQFPSCVDNCITSSGCQTDSAKCMCKAAREILLDSVIVCLFFNCKPELRTFDASFLHPIEEGCDDSGRDIPSSKLKAASSIASSYISKLSPLTTAKPTTSTSPTPTPKTTPTTTLKSASTQASSSSAKSTSTDDSSPSSTSTVDESSTSAAAERTTAAPTLVVAPTAAIQSSATSAGSSGSGSGGSGFDTNPFGSSGSSAGSAVRPLISLLGLPLGVGVAMLAMR